jgi:hypothetical protein
VRFFVPRGSLAVLVAAAALIAPGVAQADYQPLIGTSLSAPNSVWNQSLSPLAPLADNSSTLVGTLNQEVATYGPWINTSSYSVPVYTVPAGQAPITVWHWTGSSMVRYPWGLQVPLPANARPAPGTDATLVVWQPSTDTMWEFWQLSRDSTGLWSAHWGARIAGVNSSPGYLSAPFGATASGLVNAGGLMTIQEQSAGVINHALALAIPTPSTSFVFPAGETDGHNTSPSAIPEGTRFRLPASLNIAALNLPRQTAMMALAAQRYGILVRDTAGSVSFYGEDPYQFTQKYGIDPYGPYLFQNQSPAQLLASFPWKYLQVVHP